MESLFSRFKTQNTPIYSPLTGDDRSGSCSSSETVREKPLEPEQNERRTSWSYRTVSMRTAVIISLITAVILTAALIPLGRYTFGLNRKLSPLMCGRSAEEALANGCVFDILGYAWTPAACHDTETAGEFVEWLSQSHLDHGAFPFFEDSRLQKRVPGAVALSKRIGMPTYAPQQEHLAHCVFSARRHFRSAENPKLRRVKKSLVHKLHCSMELESLLTTNASQYTSELHIGFATC